MSCWLSSLAAESAERRISNFLLSVATGFEEKLEIAFLALEKIERLTSFLRSEDSAANELSQYDALSTLDSL